MDDKHEVQRLRQRVQLLEALIDSCSPVAHRVSKII